MSTNPSKHLMKIILKTEVIKPQMKQNKTDQINFFFIVPGSLTGQATITSNKVPFTILSELINKIPNLPF